MKADGGLESTITDSTYAASCNIEVVEEISEEDWEQIVSCEKETFSWGVEDESMDELREIVFAHDSIVILVRDGEGKIVGYQVSYPGPKAAANMAEADPEMDASPEALYVETAMVVPRLRGHGVYDRVHELLREKASRSGYTRITGHISADAVDVYKEKRRAEIRHSKSDWYGSGKTFSYYVININDSDETSADPDILV